MPTLKQEKKNTEMLKAEMLHEENMYLLESERKKDRTNFFALIIKWIFILLGVYFFFDGVKNLAGKDLNGITKLLVQFDLAKYVLALASVGLGTSLAICRKSNKKKNKRLGIKNRELEKNDGEYNSSGLNEYGE